MTISIDANGDEATQQAHEQYKQQEHFLKEGLYTEVQPWEPLQELGLEGLGRWLLRLAHMSNNSVLNTGYPAWQRVVGYKVDAGKGWRGVLFYTHGDFGSKSGGTTYLHRYVKVIRFDDTNDIRVRFLTEREYMDGFKPTYLVGLFDQNYKELDRYLDNDRDKAMAFDISNHVFSGVMSFTDQEPTHPAEPPLTKGALYQTWTTVIPVQQPVTD